MKKETEEKEKRKFPWSELFWIFLIGSVIGAYWEEFLHVYRYYKRHAAFDYSVRRGVFWGPISPIYGAGAVLMTVFLVGKKDKSEVTFLKAAFIGGALEYVISFFQEYVLGTSSWNYDAKLLSIGGRTNIPYMLFWGLLGLIFLKFVYPLLKKMIDKIPKKIFKPLTIGLVVLLSIDILISWTALGRQTLRHNDVKPFTFIGEYYDEHFDDDYIKKKFPNTIRVR